jgi:hypothetical protein
MIYIVVCTAVAMQRPRDKVNKQRSFLGNGSVPAATNTHARIEERCFLCGPCREVITRTVGAMNSVEFSTGSCEENSCKSAAVKRRLYV